MAGRKKKDERREPAHEPEEKKERKEYLSGEADDVEQASEDSFPASDPPSHTPVTHTGRPSK